MVVGVPGEVVVNGVVLELRRENAHILDQPMEDLSVVDLQDKRATIDIVLVINMFFMLTRISYFITLFVLTVNGGWSSWGECEGPCLRGYRRRYCNNPPPQHGGSDCYGSDTKDASCGRVISCATNPFNWLG